MNATSAASGLFTKPTHSSAYRSTSKARSQSSSASQASDRPRHHGRNANRFRLSSTTHPSLSMPATNERRTTLLNLNRVLITGYLGKTPETTPAGSTTVTKFSLAVTDRWKDGNGDRQERTNWLNVVVWNGN